MDSRSVLAAFEKNLPTCFTATISENRELRTAREIARTKGAKHIFLKLNSDHYSQIFEPAMKVIGEIEMEKMELALSNATVSSTNYKVATVTVNLRVHALI